MKLNDILMLMNSTEYIEIVGLHYATIKWGLLKDLELEDDLLNCKVLSICSLEEDIINYNGISIYIEQVEK